MANIDNNLRNLSRRSRLTLTNLKCCPAQCKNPAKSHCCARSGRLGRQRTWRWKPSLSYVQGVPCFPRRALTAAFLICLTLPSGTVARLYAQQPEVGIEGAKVAHRRPRAVVLGVLGAVVGGLAGFAFSKGGQQGGAGMALVGTAGGGLFGFFIGRQLDERYGANFRGTPALKIPSISVGLEGDPNVLAVRDSEPAVGGSAGVELFATLDNSLVPAAPRAVGLRGIDALSIAPRSGWLALGSRAGLYLYPPIRGPGVLVRSAAVAAVAASDTRIFAALDNRVESVPVLADSARAWPGITLGSAVRSLALDEPRAVLWASTDGKLVALRIIGDSLVVIGTAPLASNGLRMVVGPTLAAVAMGEKGVALFDVRDPTHPKVHGVWTGSRFAYDVSIDGTRLFVAAGPEGVYLVDLSESPPRTIGLARSLGFASAIVSHDGRTFILDHRTNALRRITSAY